MQFLNVPEWAGEPFVVGDVLVLKNGNRTARCVLQTHPLGLELRLSVGSELLQSHVCRGQDDLLNTFERCKTAMQEKGWRRSQSAMARARSRESRPRHSGVVTPSSSDHAFRLVSFWRA